MGVRPDSKHLPLTNVALHLSSKATMRLFIFTLLAARSSAFIPQSRLLAHVTPCCGRLGVGIATPSGIGIAAPSFAASDDTDDAPSLAIGDNVWLATYGAADNWPLLAGDAAAFVLFALVGRLSHASDALDPLGLFLTSFPFLLGWLGVAAPLGAYDGMSL